jgi:hypothetical protein
MYSGPKENIGRKKENICLKIENFIVVFYGTLESTRDSADKYLFRFRHSYIILEK